ncbi:MAG: endonuclease/exonuclease/phosphatase family protein [Deltaproteobacteria bacterium]|nr:endonuclease/exonuclease/phosphatase family protein [Deltaproteobacteria bacterium]MDQ3300560.1 endonuclease/exonuclease/phosphatase family protein [Myxococcota bacterium]
MQAPRGSLFTPVIVALLVAACAEPGTDDDPIDEAAAAFDVGKADGSGCLTSATSDDARGLVMLANDPAMTASALDAIGLHWRTAHALVEARPFADLAAVDAAPTVGPIACRVLRGHACDVRGLCERRLSVWSWNIEHFPVSTSAVDAVAATVIAEDADIIGFQEVDSIGAFDELLGKLPDHAALIGKTGFDTRVAIAYRTDRLAVIDVEDLFVGDTDRFPRAPLAVTFEITGRVGHDRLTVVSVHLKAMIDLDSRDRRRRAVIALEAWLAGRRAAGDKVIVVGDWNDDIDASRDRNVFLPLLDQPDAYAALTLDAAHRHEFSYIPFRRLIDHLVATREAADQFPALAVDPIRLDETITGYATRVSDHRPVRADLLPILPSR